MCLSLEHQNASKPLKNRLFDRVDRPEELSKKKADFFKDYHISLAIMINCKACFHRSHNTTQWMMRSLQERIHDMKGPFVLSWSYQYGKQNWCQHIFWKRGYCVARNLRQIVKVAKTLPSNLWTRLHTIAKTFSRLRVGEQNWKEFFFF